MAASGATGFGGYVGKSLSVTVNQWRSEMESNKLSVNVNQRRSEMESNNRKRLLSGRIMAAGFVGVLVGVLVIGFMPSASEEAESGVVQGVQQLNSHDNNGLTVTIHFKRGANKTLIMQGCKAKEKTSPEKVCGAANSVDRNWSAQVAIVWNGQGGASSTSGSGCATVGGTQYCW